MKSPGSWKSSFKLRLWGIGGILLLLGFATFISFESIVESYLYTFGNGSPAQETPGIPLASPFVIGPYLLIVVVFFLGILAFYWIPQDIASNLWNTLTTLGWRPVSGNLQRGFGKFHFGDWELSISIHIYSPSSHQMGLVTLLLSHSNPAIVREEWERFQECGYDIADPTLSGGITCHTTIPNLPWQVLRICSLTSAKHHTTTFS